MDTDIKTMVINGVDYVSITDIARRKNPFEPKDVVKNWMRSKKHHRISWALGDVKQPQFQRGRIRPLFKRSW